MNIQDLLNSSSDGDLKKVQSLLDSGIDINSENEEGYTALMAAARSYQVEIVAFLVKNGANVNAQSNDGLSALHHAVGETPYVPQRQSECVRILIKNNAIIDELSNTNATPLMWAAWFGCNESVNVLLENGANTKLIDNQNRTAEIWQGKKNFLNLQIYWQTTN